MNAKYAKWWQPDLNKQHSRRWLSFIRDFFLIFVHTRKIESWIFFRNIDVVGNENL